jgi:hypothetical protein
VVLLRSSGADGGEAGQRFFQAGVMQLEVTGTQATRHTLTVLVAPGFYGGAGDQPALNLGIASEDGAVRVMAEVLGLRAPGRHELGAVELVIGQGYYSNYVYHRDCRADIETVTRDSIAGRLTCTALGNCVAADPGAPTDTSGVCLAGFRLETVGFDATFRVERPATGPLPVPAGASSRPR